MAINLAEKYASKIQTHFTTQSLLAGKLSTQYDFSGVKTVKVYTPQTVPMGDYTRNGVNRYGTPVEMEDVIQELTLSQDKGFALTIDKGNNMDQMGVKAAGKMLRLQIDERAIPLADNYGFSQLAQLAGTIVGSGTAIDKTSIIDRISEGTRVLDDAEVPQDGRTLFLSNSAYKFLKHSDEFLGIDSLGEKALAKGVVGEYDNMKVVKVPSGRWPVGLNFLIVYKNSATMPMKINDTKLHQDPPGISGNLLEGRQYYDLFVFGAKAMGVYADIYTGSGGGTVMTTPTINAGTGAITGGGSGAVYKYTTDGSDPRYSATAMTGSTITAASGETMKAFAYSNAAGTYPSSVAEIVKS